MAWNTPIPNLIRSASNSLMQHSASDVKRAVQWISLVNFPEHCSHCIRSVFESDQNGSGIHYNVNKPKKFWKFMILKLCLLSFHLGVDKKKSILTLELK